MTPKPILTRMMQKLLMRTGMVQYMASVNAQMFIEFESKAEEWDSWIKINCDQCKYDPVSCSFMSPKQEECKGAPSAEIADSNLHHIERTWQPCPIKSDVNP